jgi:ABC-type antimicrobial peptide transport system permease subunit
MVYMLLPWFNQLTGKFMALDLTNPTLLMSLVGITLVTGILSGSYPALLLPSLKITNSLKGTLKHSMGSIIIRKGLVVFQFAVSILLIIGTLVVYRQMNYIMNKNLGLDKENMVFIELEGETVQRFETYKNELLKIPEVQNVTSTSGNPLSYGRSSSSPTWDGKGPDEEVEMNILMVSADFIETMDMEMVYGRGFSVDYGTDSANFIINEEAARIMGFEDPVGENLSVWGMGGQIIGLVRNFHMSSMYEPIAPLVIRYDPQNTSVAFIRIRGNTQDALLAIEQVTTDINPSFPFQHRFMDGEFEQSYRNEMTISTLSNIFAVIAIFISCLGLFGLSSFSTEQRTKEMGIRKVLGANVGKLVFLLSKDFTQLIVLSFIISAPISYYYTAGWLDKFVFKTELSLDIFIISGIAAILIGGLTVSFKSYQAASANPVDTLKEE